MLNLAELNQTAILNPFDPLVFLPPDQAVQSTIVKYVCAGTAGAFIWEILISMGANYQILLQHGIRFPIIISYISMISSLGFILASTVFQTASVPSCTMLKTSLQVFYVIAIPSTSLLFFFRTRAIFHKQPRVVMFFAFMWLAVVASCVTPFGDNEAQTIGPTKYCIVNVAVKRYTITAAIVPLINDTLIFFAISWQLWCNSSAARTVKDSIRVLIFGDYLPAFSKAMLQDGQAYYLVILTFNIVNAMFIYIWFIPNTIRILPTLPNMALMNIMACRVFRNTMLGLSRGSYVPTSFISREIRAIQSVTSVSLPEDSETIGNDRKQSQNAVLGNVSDIAVMVGYNTTHDRVADEKDHANGSSMV